MPIKKVLKLGNQQLSMPSLPFEDPLHIGKETRQLILDMKDTMLNKNGVGISAPQIGVNKRIIIFGFDKNNRYPNEAAIPYTVLLNPEFTIISQKFVDGWEGCLSVPNLRGLIPRYNKIKYSGYDQNGKFVENLAEGFHARIVQHEIDHLNGILFPKRLKNLDFFGFEDELNIF